jgi:RNA polymerase sigma-70 factor (ECF subfamily)
MTHVAGSGIRDAGKSLGQDVGGCAAGRGACRTDLSDGQLAARIRGGDARAFAQFYDRHVGVVFAYVHMRVHDRALAEDLTQEVFTSAWSAMPRLVWGGGLRTWLLRLAHNRVANHWRAAGRRPQTEDLPDDGSDRAPLAHGGDDPAGAANLRLGAEALERAVGRLDDVQAEVLALRFGADLSVRDAARAMGRSEGSVRSLQYRAVRRLAALLREEEERA